MKRKSIGRDPVKSWIAVGGCAVIGVVLIAAMWLLPQYNEDAVWHDVSEQVDTLLTSKMEEVSEEYSDSGDPLLQHKEEDQSTGSSESMAVAPTAGNETSAANEDGANVEVKLHENSDTDRKTDSNNTVHAEQTSSTKINVNRASAEELTKLPGIGPSKAEAIVQYREKHGHFQSIEELDNVKGIGEKMLEKMRPYIELFP